MIELSDASDLYTWLEGQDLLVGKPPMWWPGYGTFEVIVGAVLTQNTKWEKVEQSLENLRVHGFLSLVYLAECDQHTLMELIAPSGLYKTKSLYLRGLCRNIIETYTSFEHFKTDVDREWLLAQKGVGPETADSILCYACERPEMVVDAYTARLLSAFGLEYEGYDDIKAWCESGAGRDNSDEALRHLYARFHGMIVEYVKANSKGKRVIISEN
jgi:endonuclease-3 related protein